MRGYDVVTSDDRVVGTVLDVRHGYLIVESGRLRKTRHPVPREFVHVVDETAKAFVTVPRRILMDAPRVAKDGEFDRAEAARHFGLAESDLQPPAEDAGDVASARTGPGLADEHHPSSTALFGDRRFYDRRVKND